MGAKQRSGFSAIAWNEFGITLRTAVLSWQNHGNLWVARSAQRAPLNEDWIQVEVLLPILHARWMRFARGFPA